jgi:surfeit locus 1 family protein
MTASAAAGLSPLGKAFFGSLCAGTFGLGCWQTQRFFEKKELVKKNEHDLSLPPIPLSESGNDLTSLRRRLVNGTFQHNREILVGPRGPPPGAMASTGPSSGRSEGGMSSGPQGYFVITPLKSSDGTTVLINRGWVPRHFVQPDNRTSAPPSKTWERPTGQVEVTGIPIKPEQPRIITPQHDFSKNPPQLFYMDEAALNELAGINQYAIVSSAPKPMLLQEIRSSTNEGSVKFPVQPPLETVGEFKVTPMIHAGYALTWFGLASAGVVMTRKLITKGR